MANEKKTPLELLQAEAADYLDPWNMPAITRAALDAFLVQAFDLGVKAMDDLADHLRESPELPRENWSMEQAEQILGQPTED